MKSHFILRHAQSMHNKNLTKNLDSALTDIGIKQAILLANRIATYDLDGYVMHISPFLRCLMTAKAISDRVPKLIGIIDPLLSEALSPNYSGVFIPRRQYDFPQFDWSHFVGAGFLQHHEDGREFFPRIESAYGRMQRKAVVVSHGMSCLAFAKRAAGTLQKNEGWDDSIGNASLTHVEDRVIKEWGCDKHLKVNS